MKTKSILITVAAMLIIGTVQYGTAQITINLPKFPKIKKTPKESQTTTTTTSTTTPQTATAEKVEEPFEDTDGRILLFRDEVKKTREEVEEYTPETKTVIVGGGRFEWLMRAISPKERAEFFQKWGSLMSPKYKTFFTTELDAISQAAAEKIQLNVLSKTKYTYRNPAEERMIKAQLADIPGMTIHRIGLDQNTWLIGKNDYGLPINRYKHGVVWGRDPGSDHPYCRFWYVNIIQDYAGGGTYGASYA
ncbi:MAG TPA: hypothetical protein VK612_05980, partial [Pyrinomonadaceae bacterium]|nr:hypothetical protein [Pyrinomonadaceae bacterium]